MSKINYYNRAIKLLQELHKDYPLYAIAQHLSTALADYGDFWGMTDKEFCFALEKYQKELALDRDTVVSDEYIKRIQEDAMNLSHIFDKEESEEDEYGN